MRFPPLAPEQLSPRQLEVLKGFQQSRSGGIAGPFEVLLESPEIAQRVQLLGQELRFNLRVPERLRALAILVAASRYRADDTQRFAAMEEVRSSGLSSAKQEALSRGVMPPDLSQDEQLVYEFSHEVTRTGRVRNVTFDALAARVGKEVCLELVVLCGYVLYLTSLFNITQTKAPIH
jgi:4-carboxymuconolactone decarboxylase